MQSSKEIKIGAILSYIIIVINMLIGILYTPILTAKLGQTEYGLYSLVTSVISYLTILDFGFGNAIIIYTTRYRNQKEKDKEQKLHGMFFIIYSIIGIIAGIIGAFLWLNVDRLFGNTMSTYELEKAKILMGILTLNLVITFPLSVFSSIITSYEKFVLQKVLNIIRIVLNPIVMIVLLNLGYKSIALVVLTTVLNIGTLIINCIYCRKELKIKLKFGKIDFKLLREIMAYSVWIFLNSIMDKFNVRTLKKLNKKIFKLCWLCKSTMIKAKEFGFTNNTYIYNPNKFITNKKADVINNKKIVVITRIHPEKRIDLMIDMVNDVLKEFPDWTFEIYGSGSFNEESKKILNISKQIFYKGVTESPLKVLLGSSLTLNTSIYEGFSLSIIEGFSVGIPVIAFNFGESAHEQIIDDYNGYVIEKDNIELFKTKLKEILNNTQKLEELSRNSKEFSRQFEISKVADKWEKLFKK